VRQAALRRCGRDRARRRFGCRVSDRARRHDLPVRSRQGARGAARAGEAVGRHGPTAAQCRIRALRRGSGGRRARRAGEPRRGDSRSRCRSPRRGAAGGGCHAGRHPAARDRRDAGAGAASMRAGVLPAPLADIPWRVLIPLTLLVCFGAAVLYSAAGGSFQPFAASHLLRFAIFLTMALVLRMFPRDIVMWAAYPAYAAVLVLLMVVEAIGAVGGGSQRWIDLGFMQLQPSEFMKPTIVLVLATFYHSLPAGMINTWRALVPAGVLIGLPLGLVLLQPDLGTALAIGLRGAVVMFY